MGSLPSSSQCLVHFLCIKQIFRDCFPKYFYHPVLTVPDPIWLIYFSIQRNLLESLSLPQTHCSYRNSGERRGIKEPGFWTPVCVVFKTEFLHNMQDSLNIFD